MLPRRDAPSHGSHRTITWRETVSASPSLGSAFDRQSHDCGKSPTWCLADDIAEAIASGGHRPMAGCGAVLTPMFAMGRKAYGRRELGWPQLRLGQIIGPIVI
jgi:hypothetical protein